MTQEALLKKIFEDTPNKELAEKVEAAGIKSVDYYNYVTYFKHFYKLGKLSQKKINEFAEVFGYEPVINFKRIKNK